MYGILKGEVHSNIPAEQLVWTSGVQKVKNQSSQWVKILTSVIITNVKSV